MKRYAYPLLGLALLILLGALVFTSICGNPVKAEDPGDLNIPAALNSLPLLPTAEQKEQGLADQNHMGRIQYYVHMSVAEVIAFYKQYLPKDIWISTSDSVQETNSDVTFSWPGDIHNRPWNITLLVSAASGTANDNRANVNLALEKWPIVAKTQLFKDPQRLIIETAGPHDTIFDIDDYTWIATYSTQATPTEVKLYYTNNLLNWGWNEGKTEGDYGDWLSYSFVADEYPNLQRHDAVLELHVQIDSAGLTQVEMQIRGSDRPFAALTTP